MRAESFVSVARAALPTEHGVGRLHQREVTEEALTRPHFFYISLQGPQQVAKVGARDQVGCNASPLWPCRWLLRSANPPECRLYVPRGCASSRLAAWCPVLARELLVLCSASSGRAHPSRPTRHICHALPLADICDALPLADICGALPLGGCRSQVASFF